MISKREAREKIVALISESQPRIDLVVLDDKTLEYAWGWVFFTESKRYLETGDFLDAIYGNDPYIVNRESGEVVRMAVKEYESTLQK